MATDQADSHQGFCRVQHLSEDIGTQRKSAEILEHGCESEISTVGLNYSEQSDANCYVLERKF